MRNFTLLFIGIFLMSLNGLQAQFAGALDLSYQTNGEKIFNLVTGNNFTSDAALQSQNRLLVLEQSNMVRLDSTGKIDSSFASNGVLAIPFSYVAVGANDTFFLAASTSGGDVFVRKYSPDGQLVSSFGIGGTATHSTTFSDFIRAIALQPDGKILALAQRSNAGNRHLVLRFNTDGTLDTSFGSSGEYESAVITSGQAWDIALQSNNKIILAGNAYSSINHFSLIRLNTNGTIDNTFGSSGLSMVAVSGRQSFGKDIAIQPDDKIIFSGHYDDVTSYDMALMRFTANGSLDPSFGSGGIITEDLTELANDVLLQSDGKIIMTGQTENTASGKDVLTFRYNNDGSDDNSFGPSGVNYVSHDVVGEDEDGKELLLDNQNRLYVVGWADNAATDAQLMVLRYGTGLGTCTNTSASTSPTVCDSYTAPDGAVYTSSGSYTAVIPNTAGCDSTISINLTVNSSSSNTINPVVCDSYTAPDGAVYTNSGNYTAVIPNTAGCDSTISINLTVNSSSSSTINPLACDSYTAPDGAVYTSSGNYTAVIPNTAGCDSTISINLTVNSSSSSTINPVVCDSYTAPDGAVYTTSGTYTAVLTNFADCDSTITINLTINTSTSSVLSPVVCDSYTAPDGVVYTSSGSYTAVIPNTAGCDSTILINLTVNNSASSTINPVACGSYVAPNGAVYTSAGTYTVVIQTTAGCDSTITINLSLGTASSASINPVSCGSYTAPDGAVYNSSGTYTAVIPNTTGCDSTITINLTVNSGTSSTISPVACDSYTAPDGNVYIISGTYTAVIPNAAGCDSTITINLTIPVVNISVSVFTAGTVTANAQGPNITYQWLDCAQNFAPIPGATNATFTATSTQEVAVEINDGNCVDTSTCYTVVPSSTTALEAAKAKIYPNPSTNYFIVELPEGAQEARLTILDASGRLLHEQQVNRNQQRIDWQGAAGLYLLRLSYEGEVQHYRLVRQTP